MSPRALRLVAVLLAGATGAAQAAEWTEILVTTGDIQAVEMAEGRKVMSYYATGSAALMTGEALVPQGSFACAGMIDAGADGSALALSCATTDTDGDLLYSEVARGKDAALPADQGRYAYTGGTGKWTGFTADCIYEVHRMPNGQAVEFGRCTGPALPPPLR